MLAANRVGSGAVLVVVMLSLLGGLAGCGSSSSDASLYRALAAQPAATLGSGAQGGPGLQLKITGSISASLVAGRSALSCGDHGRSISGIAELVGALAQFKVSGLRNGESVTYPGPSERALPTVTLLLSPPNSPSELIWTAGPAHRLGAGHLAVDSTGSKGRLKLTLVGSDGTRGAVVVVGGWNCG